MLIGILGGTFDPPHIGHLILAAEAVHQLHLNTVLFVVTPFPPHKRGWLISPVEDRLRMVQLAIEQNADFQISRVDIDRPSPHYAVDSMNILRQQFPHDNLIYLMGADSLRDLPTWHQANQFLSRCDGIGVMQRSLDDLEMQNLEQQLPGIRSKVTWLTAPRFDISSREIRERVKMQAPYRYFVSEKVFQYIVEKGLYRN